MKFQVQRHPYSSTRKHTLWKEITLILLIKITFLFVLWKVCFSDPIEKHLTVQHMQQQIIGK